MKQILEAARRLWPHVEPLLPDPPERALGSGGRPRISDQRVFELLVLFLLAGCSWAVFDELLRGSGCSGRTVRDRLRAWREAGAFERIEELIRSQLAIPEVAYLDATFIRARTSGEGIGLTRHGKGCKLQVLVSPESLGLAWLLDEAGPHEKALAPATLEQLEDELPELIVADKGYDYDDLRDEVAARGAKLLAPHRKNRSAPPRDQERIGRYYKQRGRVERLFAWLAAFRRVATRWERSLANYRAWLCLALSLTYARAGFLP